MTSFMIKAHENRDLPETWKTHPECAFCKIISGIAPAFKVYEDDKIIAVLDILPLRRGHTLVIPKTHEPRVSELPAEFAAAVGVAVSKISNAIAQGLENTALNVVCNQEYAQAVPHVHYHIIPAPKFDSVAANSSANAGDRVTRALTQKEMHFKEFEARDELDPDDADQLLSKIRARL